MVANMVVSEDQIIKKDGKKFKIEKIKFPKSNVKIQSFVFDDGVEYFGTNKGLWIEKGKWILP